MRKWFYTKVEVARGELAGLVIMWCGVSLSDIFDGFWGGVGVAVWGYGIYMISWKNWETDESSDQEQ